MNILIIEDEPSLSNSISDYLSKEGFHIESASTFVDAEQKINIYNYDCILVDIGLPDGSGLDIIYQLKKKRELTGIIVISAKNSLEDKIKGLEIGADDYLTKPFDLAELNARVKALIRRKSFEGYEDILFNELKVVPNKRQVFIKNKELLLTRKEYDLLLYFLANPNWIITKESIAEHLWGDYMDMADSFDFIYAHIKNLRKKILKYGGADYIQTVYGVGYKFVKD